jgi:hypothetical protein
VTDPDLDWIWHTYFHVAPSTTDSIFGWTDGGPGVAVDSRAMRKLGADSGVLFTTRISTAVGGANIGFGFRCLIKE